MGLIPKGSSSWGSFKFRVVCLFNWLLTKSGAPSQPCYLTPGWREKRCLYANYYSHSGKKNMWSICHSFLCLFSFKKKILADPQSMDQHCIQNWILQKVLFVSKFLTLMYINKGAPIELVWKIQWKKEIYSIFYSFKPSLFLSQCFYCSTLQHSIGVLLQVT